MTKTLVLRAVYIRVTDDDGKRRWQRIGSINRKGVFRLDKGIPLPGIFEV